jgi:hypothetical protein
MAYNLATAAQGELVAKPFKIDDRCDGTLDIELTARSEEHLKAVNSAQGRTPIPGVLWFPRP